MNMVIEDMVSNFSFKPWPKTALELAGELSQYGEDFAEEIMFSLYQDEMKFRESGRSLAVEYLSRKDLMKNRDLGVSKVTEKILFELDMLNDKTMRETKKPSNHDFIRTGEAILRITNKVASDYIDPRTGPEEAKLKEAAIDIAKKIDELKQKIISFSDMSVHQEPAIYKSWHETDPWGFYEDPIELKKYGKLIFGDEYNSPGNHIGIIDKLDELYNHFSENIQDVIRETFHQQSTKDLIGVYLAKEFEILFGKKARVNQSPTTNNYTGAFLNFANFIFAECGLKPMKPETIKKYEKAGRSARS